MITLKYNGQKYLYMNQIVYKVLKDDRRQTTGTHKQVSADLSRKVLKSAGIAPAAREGLRKDTYLNVRFNGELLEKGKARAKSQKITHSDFVEQAYIKELG